MRLIGLLAVGMILATGPRVSIRVFPTALMSGNAVRVTCHVEKRPENRSLTVALDGYRYSTLPIEGDAGPVTTQVTYEHVPCDVVEASCTVRTDIGKEFRVAQPLTVAGCS